MVAQQLYEGIELPGEGAVGLITYMRTDSTRVSEQALEDVRGYIGSEVRRGLRAGEAERLQDEGGRAGRARSDPADVDAVPPGVGARAPHAGSVLPLPLIWNRFVASQMPPATFDDTTVDIQAADYLFRVKGSVPKFAGWLAVYNQETVEVRDRRARAPTRRRAEDEDGSSVLPALSEGDTLELRELRPEQKFTQPPPRYSEATLVKALEENGIGRPSTYASIISVIQARDYVNKIEGRFKPTILGLMLVEKLLTRRSTTSSTSSTRANLEEDLDKIEEGHGRLQEDARELLQEVPEGPEARREGDAQLQGRVEPTERSRATSAARRMVEKAGKFGLFLACSGYPECDNTRELETPEPGAEGEAIEETCENCGKPMVVKRGRFGKFLACTGYPECKTTRKIITTKQGMTAAKPDQILDEKCPNCELEPRGQAGAVRRVHGVHRLSRLQVREAEVHRGRLPEGRRRHRRAQVAARQGVLRLRELSRLRLHAVEPAGARAVPEVQGDVPRREDHQAARPSAASATTRSATTCGPRNWRRRDAG